MLLRGTCLLDKSPPHAGKLQRGTARPLQPAMARLANAYAWLCKLRNQTARAHLRRSTASLTMSKSCACVTVANFLPTLCWAAEVVILICSRLYLSDLVRTENSFDHESRSPLLPRSQCLRLISVRMRGSAQSLLVRCCTASIAAAQQGGAAQRWLASAVLAGAFSHMRPVCPHARIEHQLSLPPAATAAVGSEFQLLVTASRLDSSAIQ